MGLKSPLPFIRTSRGTIYTQLINYTYSRSTWSGSGQSGLFNSHFLREKQKRCNCPRPLKSFLSPLLKKTMGSLSEGRRKHKASSAHETAAEEHHQDKINLANNRNRVLPILMHGFISPIHPPSLY